MSEAFKSVPELHKNETAQPLKFALITISSSRYEKFGKVRTPEAAEDRSGQLIQKELKSAGHRILAYRLVPDKIEEISSALASSLKSGASVIITSGGTGLTSKDLTIEALSPLFEKEIPGFGELFRYKSLEEIGTAAILTRAVAGIVKGKAVFCLPGSPNAVKLALKEIIIPEAGHIVKHIGE